MDICKLSKGCSNHVQLTPWDYSPSTDLEIRIFQASLGVLPENMPPSISGRQICARNPFTNAQLPAIHEQSLRSEKSVKSGITTENPSTSPKPSKTHRLVGPAMKENFEGSMFRSQPSGVVQRQQLPTVFTSQETRDGNVEVAPVCNEPKEVNPPTGPAQQPLPPLDLHPPSVSRLDTIPSVSRMDSLASSLSPLDPPPSPPPTSPQPDHSFNNLSLEEKLEYLTGQTELPDAVESDVEIEKAKSDELPRLQPPKSLKNVQPTPIQSKGSRALACKEGVEQKQKRERKSIVAPCTTVLPHLHVPKVLNFPDREALEFGGNISQRSCGKELPSLEVALLNCAVSNSKSGFETHRVKNVGFLPRFSHPSFSGKPEVSAGLIAKQQDSERHEILKQCASQKGLRLLESEKDSRKSEHISTSTPRFESKSRFLQVENSPRPTQMPSQSSQFEFPHIKFSRVEPGKRMKFVNDSCEDWHRHRTAHHRPSAEFQTSSSKDFPPRVSQRASSPTAYVILPSIQQTPSNSVNNSPRLEVSTSVPRFPDAQTRNLRAKKTRSCISQSAYFKRSLMARLENKQLGSVGVKH